MKAILISVVMILFLATPVHALSYEAPSVSSDIIPEEPETFSEGLWMIVKEAISFITPSLAAASGACFGVIAIGLLASVVKLIPGSPESTVEFAATTACAAILLRPSDALITLGADTVRQLSDYGKLLLPVMTSALAAQGGTASSAALYTGTVIMDTVLGTLIAELITPLLYGFLCLSVASHALNQDTLNRMKGSVKGLMVWVLKTLLYVFTGYLGITGVVSGTADAAVLKATKLTIAGAVPVVGGVIADASESILVGVGVMKSSAGIYGILALLGLCAEPFIRIAAQYLLMKATVCVCGIFSAKGIGKIMEDFTSVMGILLAMTGTVCLLLMISIVCFMKGVS